MATNPINHTRQLNNNISSDKTPEKVKKTFKSQSNQQVELSDIKQNKQLSNINKDYSIKLSDNAQKISKLYQKALKQVKNTPDLEREEKIAEIKKKVEEGLYQIDSDKIAEELVRELLKDEVALRLHAEAKNRPKLR